VSIKRSPTYETKISGICGYRNASNTTEQPIKGIRKKTLSRGFSLSTTTNAVYDIVSFSHFCEHRHQQFGRVLKICINNQHHIAGTAIESAGKSELMSEVAGELHRANPVVTLG
jgi:hypothetical protein